MVPKSRIQGGFYATAALLGGAAYLGEPLRLTAAMVVTTGLRAWAMVHKVSLPTARRAQAPDGRE